MIWCTSLTSTSDALGPRMALQQVLRAFAALRPCLCVPVLHGVLPRLLVDDLVLLFELQVLSSQLLELLVLTSKRAPKGAPKVMNYFWALE